MPWTLFNLLIWSFHLAKPLLKFHELVVLQSFLFPPQDELGVSVHYSNPLPSPHFKIRGERKLSNKTDTSIQDCPTERNFSSSLCSAGRISRRGMSSPENVGRCFLCELFEMLYASIAWTLIYYRQKSLIPKLVSLQTTLHSLTRRSLHRDISHISRTMGVPLVLWWHGRCGVIYGKCFRTEYGHSSKSTSYSQGHIKIDTLASSSTQISSYSGAVKTYKLKTKLRGFNPQENYTDGATSACRLS
jgi:hypothetical protein